jgi:hypothetical protein
LTIAIIARPRKQAAREGDDIEQRQHVIEPMQAHHRPVRQRALFLTIHIEPVPEHFHNVGTHPINFALHLGRFRSQYSSDRLFEAGVHPCRPVDARTLRPRAPARADDGLDGRRQRQRHFREPKMADFHRPPVA